MQRRFGPTLGAGTVVVEQPPDRTLTPAPTGVTCYVGVVEKGDPGEIISCPGPNDFRRKCGSYLNGTQLPDSAFDFYQYGQGSGQLFVVRVTDGTEVRAVDSVFSRHGGHGQFAGRSADPAWDDGKRLILTLSAKNGGRWAGREDVLAGDVASYATDIAATTVTTGRTLLKDQLKGAKLRLAGVVSKTYDVISNTAAGILTVAAGSNMAADLAAGGAPTSAGYRVWLETDELVFPAAVAGTPKGVSYVWKDGQEDEDSLFGLELYENGALVKDYPNLSLDSNNKWYIGNIINQDKSNYWADVTINHAGAITNDMRPANWYGRAVDWSSNVLTVDFASVFSIASNAASPGWVDSFKLPSTAGFSNRLVRCRLKLAFSSGSAFTVTAVAGFGAQFYNLPNGSVGTAYAPQHSHVPGFKVLAGSGGWTAGDIVYIDVRPLPVDMDGNGALVGGHVYYDVGTNKRAKLRITGNTNNTITLASAPDSLPDESTTALQDTSYLTSSSLTFPLSPGVTTLGLRHSGLGAVSLTGLSGPYADAAALATDINTKWQAATSSAGNVATADGATVKLTTDSSGVDPNKGYNSFLQISGANAALGFALGDTVTGTPGAAFRVQARQHLRGGYDGDAPVAADYVAAFDTENSPINRLVGRNLGLVKLAVPGITDASVQRAGLEYAEYANYQFRVEFEPSLDDDAAAVAFINDTIGRNDFGVVAYPSYGYVPNPTGSGAVLRSLTGVIHGLEAQVARVYQGYHKAAAGVDVQLPNVMELPTGERPLNEEILNPQGITVIKKLKGNYIIWGARTISSDPGWKWKNQREQMSHYENTMRDQFDYIVFAINDPVTRLSLNTTLRGFFLPEWKKRALRGDKESEAFTIKIDGDNNTAATAEAGDLFCDIKLNFALPVERFTMRVGKAGIFETAG